MKKSEKFVLKKVTIKFELHEDEKGTYYNVYTVERSPIYYPCGSSTEIVSMFSSWLKNTLEAMPKNNCTTIQLTATWN